MLFRPPPLSDDENEVIGLIDEVRSSLRYATDVAQRWSGSLSRVMRARALRGSNTIEGYKVTADDALAAITQEELVDADVETRRAVLGYRNAMTYALQLADDEYFDFSTGLLRSMHYMMLEYDLSKRPGKWRVGPIYVRDDRSGDTVYEAPEQTLVPALIDDLVETLNGPSEAPSLVEGAMAHLNLVMIHPFKDGNGRMARCLQTLLLARRGIVERQFCSIEHWLGKNVDEYYSVLRTVGQGAWHPENDARPWVRFILKAHYQQAMSLRAHAEQTSRIWDELEYQINRHGLPDRVIYALFDATVGYAVRNATYRSVANVSETVASRDLKLLVEAGFLESRGQTRGRAYAAATILRELRQRTRERKPEEDPFDVIQPKLF